MKLNPFLVTVCAAILFLLACVAARADDLVWDDGNPAGKVKQFNVYRETDLGAWTNIATVTTNRWKITLPAGIYRLAVSAVGVGTNEVSSPLSSPLLLTVFVVPGALRIEK
jgi:hypothetical protein